MGSVLRSLISVWTDSRDGLRRCRRTARSGVFEPKIAGINESIALDASITHMYAPGTRRHIKAALYRYTGATIDENMDVLKLCVAQGVQAFNMGIPILDEELSRTGG